jgi:YD repeat-containing protein
MRLTASLPILVIVLTPALLADSPGGQSKQAQACRVGATASKTRTEGQKGFWSETTSVCTFDKAAVKSTCTNEYVDSVGTKTKSVSVTTFASVADVIEEVKIVPPLRLSTKVETKASGPVQASTTVVDYSYDAQRRLIKETVKASTAGSYEITYASWDKSGRPTAGSTVFAKAPTTTTETTYNDATRTMTTTTGTGAIKITCDMVYDANGNPAATSCQTPGAAPGSMSKSKTETTGTERICR